MAYLANTFHKRVGELVGKPDPHENIVVSVHLKDGKNSKENFDSVVSFAHDNALAVDHINEEGHLLKLSGTVADFENAFKIKLNHLKHPKGYIYRHYDGSISAPLKWKGVVGGIFGLNTKFRARSYHRVQPRDWDGGYFPNEVSKAYNFPTADGEGKTIAIVELGGGYNESDNNAYASKLNLPSIKISSISVDKGANSPTNDPDSADGEVALDIQVVYAIAPKTNILVYFAPNSDQGFMDAVTAAATANPKPEAISISWGGPEDSWSKGALNSFNEILQRCSKNGINVTVAAGDNGSSDGEQGINVDFPGSSPYVISCGGTKLTLNKDESIHSEVVWNDSDGGATGGGISKVFPRPSYQNNVVKKFRGVPDLSGNASPTTGYKIIIDGIQTVVGGTSAVAPLVAAYLVLVDVHGDIHDIIYKNEEVFNDIVEGNNGQYKARKGWDECTGLGSIKGMKLKEILEKK